VGRVRTPSVGSIVCRLFLLCGGLSNSVGVLVYICCYIEQTFLVLSCSFHPWQFELLVAILLHLGGSDIVCMAVCICRGLPVVVQVGLEVVLRLLFLCHHNSTGRWMYCISEG